MSYKISSFLRRNSSTILTFVGAIGVVGTAIVTAKETPKAIKLLQEAKEQKGENLTVIETIITAGPAYIPSIAIGAATITSILGANVLNKKQQGSLAGSYALLSHSYSEYRKKIQELYGKEPDQNVQKDVIEHVTIMGEEPLMFDKQLIFWDAYSNRYFRSTMWEVKNAEYKLNRLLILTGQCSINDFYDYLGIPKIESGNKIGWSLEAGYGYEWIDFSHEMHEMRPGVLCHAIYFKSDPSDVYSEWTSEYNSILRRNLL